MLGDKLDSGGFARISSIGHIECVLSPFSAQRALPFAWTGVLGTRICHYHAGHRSIGIDLLGRGICDKTAAW